MVIVANSTKIKLVSGIIIFLVIFYIGYLSLVPKSAVIFTDNMMSSVISNKIKNLILLEDVKNLSANKLANGLSSDYKFIKSINISFQASKEALIWVEMQDPVLIVNGNWVLVDNAHILDKDIFKESVLEKLPNVKVKDLNMLDNLDINSLLVCFKNNIKFLKYYKFKWCSKNFIILNPVDLDNLFIVVDFQKLKYSNLSINNLLNQAKEIYKQRGEGKRIKIDLRFKDQIIFSHLRGVEYEELFKIE